MKRAGEDVCVDSWDQYSKDYDCVNLLKPIRKMYERVLNFITDSDGLMLDAGCGTGNIEELLMQENRRNRVVCLDFSEKMLANLAQKLGNQYIAVRADLGNNLPFIANTFDQVVSVNCLYAQKDPKFVLKQFYRVLKRGGKLLIVNPIKGFENGIILMEHCGDSDNREAWLNAHQSKERESELIQRAFKNKEERRWIERLAAHNRIIAQNQSFNFFKKEDLFFIVESCGFVVKHLELVSAEQDILLLAEKGG